MSDDDIFGEGGYEAFQAQVAHKFYRYEIAATVLIFVALLGAIGLSLKIFRKLRFGYALPASALSTLKVSTIIYILYCALDVVSQSLEAKGQYDVYHEYESRDDSPDDSLYRRSALELSFYQAMFFTSAVTFLLRNLAVVSIYFTIVCFSVHIARAMRPGGVTTGPRNNAVYWISFAILALLFCIVCADFGLQCYSALLQLDPSYFDDFGRAERVADASRNLDLALEVVLCVVALWATTLAMIANDKSNKAKNGNNPSLLVIWAGILLMLSTLYIMGQDVHTRTADAFFGGIEYYPVILYAILGNWPLLGTLGLLYMSARRLETTVAEDAGVEQADLPKADMAAGGVVV